jgi:hypothetical protein
MDKLDTDFSMNVLFIAKQIERFSDYIGESFIIITLY